MTLKIEIPSAEIVKEADGLVSYENLRTILERAIQSDDLKPVLEEIVSINRKYGNAWVKGGIFVNFNDISDKLSRLEIIIDYGETKQSQTTMDDYGNVIFDLWVRCMLTMLLDARIERMVKQKFGVDFHSGTGTNLGEI